MLFFLSIIFSGSCDFFMILYFITLTILLVLLRFDSFTIYTHGHMPLCEPDISNGIVIKFGT